MGDVGNDDCTSVAGEAGKALRAAGWAGRTLSSSNRGEKLPFFKDLGYRHHVINLVQQRDGAWLAVDLSAHYSMDAQQGRYDVFGLLSDSEEQVKEDLRALTGTAWE